MEPELCEAVLSYARGRGIHGVHYFERWDDRKALLGGGYSWRVSMITKEMRTIQSAHVDKLGECALTLDMRAQRLVVKGGGRSNS